MMSSIFESDFGMGAVGRRNHGLEDDFELDLEMNDLLEEFNDESSVVSEQNVLGGGGAGQSGIDFDIFADADQSRQCKVANTAENAVAHTCASCSGGKKKQ